ncbi:unknown [Tropheryma whipplei str. Twist]|uniref:Uncharacterized protein n=1 Tax=Tropheryma whipplei (strain Twist) TaxID=203267 RepID=Q83GV5_TROWT|nr:unknown [Tropheryma whipplei str. Twist]
MIFRPLPSFLYSFDQGLPCAECALLYRHMSLRCYFHVICLISCRVSHKSVRSFQDNETPDRLMLCLAISFKPWVKRRVTITQVRLSIGLEC